MNLVQLNHFHMQVIVLPSGIHHVQTIVLPQLGAFSYSTALCGPEDPRAYQTALKPI